MKKIHLLISICLFILFCTVLAYAQKSQKPLLVKLPFAFSRKDRGELMENTPVFFNSRLLLVANYRPSGGPKVKMNNEMAECPVIRYFKPYYYVIFGHDLVNIYNRYTSDMVRSKNLIDWELSPFNPILQAGEGEEINNTDVDLNEYEGNTYLYNATGDQATWSTIRVAMYGGLMKTFYEKYFPEGRIFEKISTQR